MMMVVMMMTMNMAMMMAMMMTMTMAMAMAMTMTMMVMTTMVIPQKNTGTRRGIESRDEQHEILGDLSARGSISHLIMHLIRLHELLLFSIISIIIKM